MAAVDRAHLLSFRLRSMHLARRLPAGSLALAAHGGLQDSSPRTGILSLHARTNAVGPDDWESADLVQVWGPRAAVYLVPTADIAVFTLGRSPRDADEMAAIDGVAHRLREAAGGPGAECSLRDLADLYPKQGSYAVRQAAVTGTIRVRWDTRDTLVLPVAPPAGEPEEARRELARRYLHWLGPGTAATFARWAGVSPSDAAETFRAVADQLAVVTFGRSHRWVLASDETDLRGGEPVRCVRLLPPGDPYLAMDREIVIPDAERRAAAVPPSNIAPGVVVVDGEVRGTWRRQQATVTLAPWPGLTDDDREAAESEARAFPVVARAATVGAGDGDGAVGRHQFPRVAEAVVMDIDAADPAEPLAGVVLAHHTGEVIDPAMAFAGEGGIGEASVLGPRPLDELGSGDRIGFGEGGEVGVDDRGDVEHRLLGHCCLLVSWGTEVTFFEEAALRTYL